MIDNILKIENIKKARIKIGLTQKEIAQKLGIAYENYNRIETGRGQMSGETLTKLLKLLCKKNLIEIKKIMDY